MSNNTETKFVSMNINDYINRFGKINILAQISGHDVGFPYLQGNPGMGKTAAIQDMANNFEFAGKQYKACVVSTHFALKPLEETGGIPQFENIVINGQEVLGTVWSFPDLLKSIYKLSENYDIVIWLLDDMHLCSHIHMAMLYELLTERKMREYKIPDNCAILLAGNTSNKAGAKTTFSAIVNRVHIAPVISEVESWKVNFAIKDRIHSAVQSFLENDMYRRFFHEEEQVDTPWCSPRSWTRFAHELTLHEQINGEKPVDSHTLTYLCQGYNSKESTGEFVAYYKIYNKFDLPNIIKQGEKYKLPEEIVDRYALASALTNYYINNRKQKDITENFSAIVHKFMKESPELSIMILKELINSEKILNIRTLYNNVALQLEKIDSDLFNQIIEEILTI